MMGHPELDQLAKETRRKNATLVSCDADLWPDDSRHALSESERSLPLAYDVNFIALGCRSFMASERKAPLKDGRATCQLLHVAPANGTSLGRNVFRR